LKSLRRSGRSSSVMIKLIKAIHTVIWAIMATANCYILYAGIIKKVDTLLWASIGLIVFEVFILVVNRWRCPLTPVAMKYTSDRNENFDIYLPNWLAKNNKLIFGIIFIAGLLLVIRNSLSS
jgi:hypothetical protein